MGRLLAVRRRYANHETLLFRALVGPLERLRGLLGTHADAAPVALVRCASIHTWGMGYRIDVAFVDESGLVMEVWRAVVPGRVITVRGAWVTLERPALEGPWLARGERVHMSWMEDARHAERSENGAEGWNEVYVCGNAGA